jgi:tetratricopeptide (TPR) repeat protein
LSNCFNRLSQEVWSRPEAAQWLKRADHYAEPGTVGRAWADQGNGFVKYLMGYFSQDLRLRAEGRLQIKRAYELVLKLDDYEALWYIPTYFLLASQAPQYLKERAEAAEELASRMGDCSNSVTLAVIGGVLLESGQRRRYEECCSLLKTLAERMQQSATILTSMRQDGILTFLDGKFEAALEISDNIETRGKEMGIPEFAAVWAIMTKAMPLVRLGRAERVQELAGLLNFPVYLLKVVCCGRPDKDVEAGEILEKLVVNRPCVGTNEDMTAAYLDSLTLEAAVLAGHQQSAKLLLSRLASCSHYIFNGSSVARNLGGAAALLGSHDEARQYYQEAIKVCTEMSFRPEPALSRLQFAELLLEHYPAEKKEALEHLDFAIKEFREMKMQPSLERALRHKGILKA